MKQDNKFEWTADLVKEFCEYAGLRIGKNTDIREQLNYLIENFKLTRSASIDVGRDGWEVVKYKVGESVSCFPSWYEGQTILSVLRKSDNSVWTVLEKTNYGTIEKFFIEGGMNVHFTNGCGATLQSLSKFPPDEKTERPPLGIMPMDIWKEKRLEEIHDAIVRYIEADMTIPSEWIYERNELVEFIKPKIKL